MNHDEMNTKKTRDNPRSQDFTFNMIFSRDFEYQVEYFFSFKCKKIVFTETLSSNFKISFLSTPY